MAKLAQLILGATPELAKADALAMGHPVGAYFDGYVAAMQFRYWSEAAYPVGTTSLNTPGFVNISLRQPYGVCGAIIPWNAAALFVAMKLGPALAAGNTVVLKTSEKAPTSPHIIAGLLNEAGFPPGVFNVVHGHGPGAGHALAAHMGVRALSFTGSVRTGRAVQRAAADSNLKHLMFELGGKSPAVIFADADLDRAVEETFHSITHKSGQTCIANSRIYVQKGVAAQFVEKFTALAAAQKRGDPLDAETRTGPVVDKIQFERIKQYIEEGKKTGELAIPENAAELLPQSGKALFVPPTVFLNQPEDAKVMKEEIFGPVVCINTFETEEEALKLANDTEFGLYSAVYTSNLDTAMRCAKGLESGLVGVNCTSPTAAFDMPLGGAKQSGVGREGYLHSLDDWVETKSVFIRVGGGAK